MADTKERKLPAPAVSAETQAYWDAAAKGKLLVRKCTSCGELHHYPRTICPFCFSDKTEWITASGKGTIYSFSVMRRAPVPYVLAYVTLPEGPSMMMLLGDADPIVRLATDGTWVTAAVAEIWSFAVPRIVAR